MKKIPLPENGDLHTPKLYQLAYNKAKAHFDFQRLKKKMENEREQNRSSQKISREKDPAILSEQQVHCATERKVTHVTGLQKKGPSPFSIKPRQIIPLLDNDMVYDEEIEKSKPAKPLKITLSQDRKEGKNTHISSFQRAFFPYMSSKIKKASHPNLVLFKATEERKGESHRKSNPLATQHNLMQAILEENSKFTPPLTPYKDITNRAAMIKQKTTNEGNLWAADSTILPKSESGLSITEH